MSSKPDWITEGHLEYDETGSLTVGGVNTLSLVKRYGTPLLVMNENRMKERYRKLYRSLKKRYEKVRVYYAVKANPCLAVLKVLLDEGAGLEVASEYELLSAIKSGARGERIIYNGPNKSSEGLKLAVENGVLINVDSLSELKKLERVCESLRKRAKVGIRVNPGMSLKTNMYLTTGARTSQFGIYLDEAKDAFIKAFESESITLKGFQMHIGSQITSLRWFRAAINKIFPLIAELKESGIELEYLDLGGGLGVKYEGTNPPSADEYAEVVVSAVESNIKKYSLEKPHLFFEPGRYIVADAGVFLLGVGDVKTPSEGNKWVIVDGGSNILLRAALGIYKFKIISANKANSEPKERVNVAGPLCFGGDVIGRDVKIPAVEEGDILAVFCAGAYTSSISSQYHMRPRPPIVLVNDGKPRLIQRAEKYEDLIARDDV